MRRRLRDEVGGLKAYCHVDGKIGYSFILSDIGVVHDKRIGKIHGILFLQFPEGGESIPLAALYLNRGNVVTTGNLGFCDKEIYFHTFISIVVAILTKKEKLVSCGAQHLADNIFNNHTFIDLKFSKYQFLVNLNRDTAMLIKTVTDK